jgi:hypothetical protein
LSQLTLQINPRSLQEHSTSMNSVPCAYFRVSLRDCAIHSSRWVDFADFGLMGFRFFVRLVKMTRTCINETTARLRCVRVFVKLCSVTYVTISCCPIWPLCAIMREDPRIFYANTLRHLLVEDMHFYSLDCRSKYFFARTWKRTSWRTRRYAGCPWGRHGCSWDAIWVNKCVREKSARFLTTRAEVTTFLLLRHAHARAKVEKLRVWKQVKAYVWPIWPRGIWMWTLVDLKMRCRP